VAVERRFALLVGSTLSLDEATPRIPVDAVRANLDTATEAVSQLGDFSFGWPHPAQPPKRLRPNPSRAKIVSALSGQSVKPSPTDLLLFYYCGHGFVGPNGQLTLALAGASLDGDPINGHLNEIVREFIAAGFRRIVVVLDCCHAGLTVPDIALNTAAQFYLMAATGRGRSYFDNKLGGRFTRALNEALSPGSRGLLRDPQKNAATLARWFSVAADLVHGQQPAAIGNLGDAILFPAETTLQHSFDTKAPPKSLYSKLFRILQVIDRLNQPTLEELYSALKKQKVAAFQIPSPDGKSRYVQKDKIREYLATAAELDIAIEQSQKWRLTAVGRKAIAGNGLHYSRVLQEQVFQWLPPEIDEGALRQSLFGLAAAAVLPTLPNIERSLLDKGFPVIMRRDFRIALRLLSYSGVLQRAQPDTFFPR